MQRRSAAVAVAALAMILGTTSLGTTTQAATQDVAAQYWIGVACGPLDAALQSHLDLPGGLIIRSVVEKAPAQQAGLKVHDVIISVNGEGVQSLNELNRLVAKSKGKELLLDVIRGGKSRQIKIKPVKRPVAIDPLTGLPGVPGIPKLPGSPQDLQWKQWLKDPRMNLQLVRPGILFSEKLKPFPGDLSITMSKSGDGPAQITVKKGDKQWEVTEDELDKLPEDVRKHVQSLLGRRPFPGDFDLFRQRAGQLTPPGIQIDPNLRLPRAGMPDDIRKRFEQLDKRLEEMRRAMMELRRGGTPKKAKKKEAKKDDLF